MDNYKSSHEKLKDLTFYIHTGDNTKVKYIIKNNILDFKDPKIIKVSLRSACQSNNVEVVKMILPFVKHIKHSTGNEEKIFAKNILFNIYQSNKREEQLSILKLLSPSIIKNKENYKFVLVYGLAIDCKKTLSYALDRIDKKSLEGFIKMFPNSSYNNDAYKYFISRAQEFKNNKFKNKLSGAINKRDSLNPKVCMNRVI